MVDPVKRVDGAPLLKRAIDYIRGEILPVVGPGLISKKRLEDFIQDAQRPGWLDNLSRRSRRQLLTRAMDLLGRRWSDSAWVVDPEPVHVQDQGVWADARKH